jgi:hypothetical protein
MPILGAAGNCLYMSVAFFIHGGWLLTGYHLSVLFSATFVYLDYQTYGEYRATPESFNESVGIV